MTLRFKTSAALKYVFTSAVVLGGGYGAYSYVADHYVTDQELDLTHHTAISSQKDYEEKSTREAAKAAFFSIHKGIESSHGEASVRTIGEAFIKTTDTVRGTDSDTKTTRFSIVYNASGNEIARAVCRPDLTPFTSKPLACGLYIAKPKP